MPKRHSQPKAPTLQVVPDSPEVERQRLMLEEQGRELKELIKKINSRAKEAGRENESDDTPELPPTA
jgi:hypothetical protein